ncbi:protein of unknown function [Pararobbsia alpina]|uniref:hypothetical protein n=1 Tax=Pararobbsia alpina TaxID=621374 RepID=UPI0039A5BE95
MSFDLAVQAGLPTPGVLKMPDVGLRKSTLFQHKTVSNMRERYSKRAKQVSRNAPAASAGRPDSGTLLDNVAYGVVALDQRVGGLERSIQEHRRSLDTRIDDLRKHVDSEFDNTNMCVGQLKQDIDVRLDFVVRQNRDFKQDVEKRFDAVDKRFETVDKRFDELKQDSDKCFDAVDKRFEAVEKRFDRLEDKVSSLSHKMYAASVVAAVLSSVGVAALSNLDKIAAFSGAAVHQSAH